MREIQQKIMLPDFWSKNTEMIKVNMLFCGFSLILFLDLENARVKSCVYTKNNNQHFSRESVQRSPPPTLKRAVCPWQAHASQSQLSD